MSWKDFVVWLLLGLMFGAILLLITIRLIVEALTDFLGHVGMDNVVLFLICIAVIMLIPIGYGSRKIVNYVKLNRRFVDILPFAIPTAVLIVFLLGIVCSLVLNYWLCRNFSPPNMLGLDVLFNEVCKWVY
ncbi:MAG: hypothetical protein V1921_02470 [Candidatus Altiarchaeota archaeon]